MTSSETLRETAAWRRLEWHHAELAGVTLRELFDGDPGRGVRMTAEAAGLYLDYSKHRATDDTLQLLRKLAVEPVPRPTVMPSSTSSAAASAASRFSRSTSTSRMRQPYAGRRREGFH